jgi:catechol 2,3-dioxygenase-like lactoylglutathione lyase family enzyme
MAAGAASLEWGSVSIFGGAPAGLDLYHVGLVVPELESAMHAYGELFGFEWATVGPPRIQHVVVGGERRDPEIAVTYSMQGPPHLELIEERSGGVWAAESPLNHVGFWAPDLAEAVTRLTNAGGFWMEIVGIGFQSQLQAWIASSAER